MIKKSGKNSCEYIITIIINKKINDIEVNEGMNNPVCI